MIILSVKEIKSFMSHLFMKETLDSWLVSQSEVATFFLDAIPLKNTATVRRGGQI